MAVTETCVTPTGLAAFLEGNLKGEERDQMVWHLNRCPDCFERYTQTARLLGAVEEEEPALPAESGIPLPWRSRRHSWLLPLAATLLALVGGAYLWDALSGGLPSPGPELSQVFIGLPEARRAAFDEEILQIVRGNQDNGPESMALGRQAFRLGARWVDLDPALRSQSTTLTKRALRNLREVLSGSIERSDLPKQPCSRLLASGPPEPKEIDACRKVIEGVFGDRPEFALGRWTEATRLAVAAGSDRYFTYTSVQKFPERLLEVEKTSWDDRVRAELERASKLLEGGLSPGEGETLQVIHQNLARFYEMG